MITDIEYRDNLDYKITFYHIKINTKTISYWDLYTLRVVHDATKKSI